MELTSTWPGRYIYYDKNGVALEAHWLMYMCIYLIHLLQGKKPIDIARSEGHSDIVHLLEGMGH